MRLSTLGFCTALALAGCGVPQDGTLGETDDALDGMDIRPHGEHQRNGDVHKDAKPGGGGGTNGISYHGGPVMLGTVNVYYIWYGGWNGNTATTILTNWIQSEGGSAYYGINTTYYDGNGNHVSNAIHYAGSTTDNYSLGTSLTDSQIQQVVANAINGGKLPLDANAVYFVLTSKDVTASSGFCTKYCGWHTHGTIGGKDVKYSFVGNADRCPNSCTPTQNLNNSPNGNPGADAMVSIVAHEFEEATSDPDLNAWYDRRGAENADKCAWTFGTTYATQNGATANVSVGGHDYLVQQNWVNANGGFCALHL